MTIERQYSFLGIPVPFTKIELKSGTDEIIEYMHSFGAIPLSFLHVDTPDEIEIFKGAISKKTNMVVPGIIPYRFKEEAINQAKIKSDGLLLKKKYHWKPTK